MPPIDKILIVLAIFLSCATGYAWDSGSYQQGLDAAEKTQVNPDQLNQKFLDPLVSKGSSMTTLDGSKSFSVHLPAPQASIAFLDLFAAPSASGDLSTLTFKEDMNFDGAADYSYTISVPISGVCKNGFISANPGTWTNLRYYTWSADSSGRATASEVPAMTYLAGCYCINSSCGSNLVWNNLSVVLRDLGNGIVDAIHQKKSFTITNVDTGTSTEVKYYAQNSAGMGNSTGFVSSGVANPQQFFNGGSGSLPGGAELANQSANPDSLFTKINNLNNAAGLQTTNKECNIKQQISFTAQSQIIGYDVTFYIGYDSNGNSKNCFWATADQACQNSWSSSGLNWPDGCVNKNLANLGNIVSAIVFPADQCAPYIDPGSGQEGCFPPPSNMNIETYQFISQTDSGNSPGCYGSGDNNSHQFWNIQAFTVQNPEDYHLQHQNNLVFGIEDIPQSSSTGSCAGIETDPQCVLMQETICDYDNENCVYIYNNFNPTGLTPLKSCKQIIAPDTGEVWAFCVDGNNLTYQQGADSGILKTGADIWWNINKTYSCQANDVYDFTIAKQRMATISNSFNDNGSAVTYNDIGSSGNSISLPPQQEVSPCEISCVVKVPAQDTQASLSGTTADYRASVNGYQKVIRQCQNDICPLNAGETLVQDCGCVSYFKQAASMMQLMDKAGKDIICSDSPP